MLCPSAKVAAIVVRHMAASRGSTEGEASVSLVEGVLSRTAASPDMHRASLVSQLQRAIRDIDVVGADRDGEDVCPFPGFSPWYIPRPNLALLRPACELDPCRSPQKVNSIINVTTHCHG